MKKLLITRSMPAKIIETARDYFDVTHRNQPGPMSEAETREAFETYDIVMTSLGDPLGAAAFRGGPFRCQMLANYGVGVNHIDVAAAVAAGMLVSNTPGAVTDATADIGVMLMLMAARRGSAGEAMLRAGEWGGWDPTQELGLHISGKTLGVIGMGRIGRAVARRCHHGFGMDVVYFNRSTLADPGLPARQLDSLEAVAQAADAVVVCVPGSPQTHHLIGAKFFRAMQAHGVFVNISRGDVVDEAALIQALQSGDIAGAGLDVYEHEPDVPAALIALRNVTLLPHMGTSSLEVREQMGAMALANLRAWAAGEIPPDLVAP